ncbi:hypothetical protein GCM10010245_66610 [Streptomyces spectabilis]|nr:hypothetical protein GCM10010245_66610 [Streptomyces spectabilis]
MRKASLPEMRTFQPRDAPHEPADISDPPVRGQPLGGVVHQPFQHHAPSVAQGGGCDLVRSVVHLVGSCLLGVDGVVTQMSGTAGWRAWISFHTVWWR